MVTILEPREAIPVEPAPLMETVSPPRPVPRREWGYSMPCAGVRYYSYRPVRESRPVPEFLPVKLIDERVILL